MNKAFNLSKVSEEINPPSYIENENYFLKTENCEQNKSPKKSERTK